MKIASIIGLLIALALIIVNTTKIDSTNLFAKDSSVALIGIVSGLIAIVIILLFNVSKTIERKSKQ